MFGIPQISHETAIVAFYDMTGVLKIYYNQEILVYKKDFEQKMLVTYPINSTFALEKCFKAFVYMNTL